MSMMEEDRKYLAQTYARQGIALVRGRGTRVFDSKGKEYIDCFAGIAVLNVGHCHPKVTKAICEQAKEIMHTSNIYHILPQIELGKALYELSGGYRSFFCNSGAEANEAAIKLAKKVTGKNEIVAAEESFHGRTIATLSATGQEKHKVGFGAMMPGFKHVRYGDVEGIKGAMTGDTAAVVLEPIQGEGGVVVPPEGYLNEVKEVCEERGVLFILDEVQTGLGRTGEVFAWQYDNLEPDVFTLAKGLGGGFPIGAMLAKPEVMEAFVPGDHASTFGGNHLACAAAKAALEVTVEEGLARRAREIGGYFRERLEGLGRDYDFVKEVRGRGLMLGMELEFEGREMVERAREKGVLMNCCHDRVLRFVPPLIITKEEIDRVMEVLVEVFGEVAR